jgi:hypothetical protein
LNPKPFILLVVLAFGLAGALHLSFPYQLSVDGVQYVAFGHNLAEGHGITRANVHLDDLGKVWYTPMLGYPPGYFALLAPWGALGMDLYQANALLTTLGNGLYFLFSLLLLQVVGFQAKSRMFWGAVSLFLIVPISYGNSSDLWSAVFFQGGLWLSLWSLKEEKGWGSILAALLLLAAASVRYAYYPLAFIPPAVIGFLAWRAGRRAWLGRAVLMAGLIALGILSISFYLKSTTGQTTYTNEGFAIPDDRLIYPENLKKFDAFGPKAFFHPHELLNQLARLSGKPELAAEPWTAQHPQIAAWLRALGLLLSLPVFLVMGWWFGKKYFASPWEQVAKQSLHGILILAGLTTVALLVFLSLRDPHQRWGEWTYVEETRYYSPLMFYLFLGTLWAWEKSKKRGIKILAAALLLLHGIYGCWHWSYERLLKDRPVTEMEEIYHAARALQADSELPVVYSGPSISEMYFVSVAGVRPLMSLRDSSVYMYNHNYGVLTRETLFASQPVELLVSVPHNELEEPFVKRHRPQKVLSLSSRTLYKLRLK